MELTYLLFSFFLIINLFGITLSSTYEECGTLNEDFIYNKTNVAHSEEFPWTARLGYRLKNDPTELKYYCLGVLVSKRAVLTANHCLHQKNNQDLVVVEFGNIHQAKQQNCDKSDCDDLPQVYNIEEIILNPNYNRRSHGGDIGILILEKDVTFSKYVQPICLPPAELTLNELITKHLYVAGYPFSPKMPSDGQNKMKGFAQIVSPEACQSAYRKELESDLICGFVEDQLQFLSGTSLMDVRVESNKPKNFYIVGLVSAGSGIPNALLPDVFANVATHLDWIKKNL